MSSSCSILIQGMTCNACVDRIERCAKKEDGITDMKVSLAEGKAEVKFDESKTSPDKIASFVEDLGFSCQVAK